MHHHRLAGWLPLALAATCGAALAQPDPNYVAPKGGYDTPGSVLKPMDAVGETYERTLGEPKVTAYQRPVRLKMLGLETVSRLSNLQAEIKKDDAAEQKRQSESSDGKGGLLGGLLSRVNPLLSKEVERQQEVAKDNFVVRLIEAGSPADTAAAATVDMMLPPNQVTGSIFGAKINNKVRVAVSSDDFKPRVLIVRHRPKSGFTPLQGDATPEFSVVANVELASEDQQKAIATFDRSKESADGSVNLYIVVTSADSKATTGKYKIRYYPQE